MSVYDLQEYILNTRPKSAGKVLLIRHANELESISPHGWSDLDLSKLGVRNAKKLAAFLQTQNLHNLYTSDLRRALHTAEIIGERLNIRPNPDFELRPWNIGVLANGPPEEVIPIIKYHIKEDPNSRIKGGESFDNFLMRFKTRVLRYIMMAARYNQNIGVVIHSKTLFALNRIFPSMKFAYKGPTPPSSVLLVKVGDLNVSRIY